MTNIDKLAKLYAAATKDNTKGEEYRVAVDAALPGLLEELRELRADKERLDWMQAAKEFSALTVRLRIDDSLAIDVYDFSDESMCDTCEDVREAIDAARSRT